MNKKNKKELNEVIDINGSKVFVEDGEVKTILSEEIQQSGYMSVEEARNIGHEIIKKQYQLNNENMLYGNVLVTK